MRGISEFTEVDKIANMYNDVNVSCSRPSYCENAMVILAISRAWMTSADKTVHKNVGI